MFHEGCWPEFWKLHTICPLYKKKSAFDPGNYRGVHLTPILSKIAEHVIGKYLIDYLRKNSFGPNQWAFTPGRSARDLVTCLVMKWILAFCKGLKVGAYLSDITGAFDTVCKEHLMAKLQAAGVGEKCLKFMNSYLETRIGRVVVEGEMSDDMVIDNSVFQGTVLGPTLWNLFFADVATPARSGGEETMFADDLSVFQEFDRETPSETIREDLAGSQGEVAKSGARNRVEFDKDKEHFAILHPIHGKGELFKLLGCCVDAKLTMCPAIDRRCHRSPRRSPHYCAHGHIMIFRISSSNLKHTLGIMEANSGGIFHACSSQLDRLDRCQKHFVENLGSTEEAAFINNNFAPPVLRRNIDILGLIHKRVLDLSHSDFEQLLPWRSQYFGQVREDRHTKQLYNHALEVHFQVGLLRRSIFAMTDVYKMLPQYVTDSVSMSVF